MSDRAMPEIELLFDQVLEGAPNAVALVSTEGRFLKVNRAICAFTGYSATELLAMSISDITHPADRAATQADVQRMLSGGTLSFQREKQYLHKDGHTLTGLVSVSFLRTPAGAPRCFVSQIQDTTERKKTEEALRLLSSAVEQAKESIMITDAELNGPGPRIVFVNPAFTKMTGYTAAEAIGQTPRILQGPKTDRTVLDRLRRDLERGDTFDGEAINYRKDGTPYDQEWRVAPIRDDTGHTAHFVAILRDVTERNAIEAQLSHARRMEAVGTFAGGLAHEFNSILTAIIGQSDLLIDDLPASSALAWNAVEIRDAAQRAASLTRQFAAFGGRQFLKPTSFDLNALLARMDAALRRTIARNITLAVVPWSGLTAVHADAMQVEQIILNIASNAAAAMPMGGTITLTTANVVLDQEYVRRFPHVTAGEYVLLSIADTGIGMSEDVRARVFEPFFTTKGVGEGTGLALSMCYGIIRQSGGHISVDSALGRGSTFSIFLPYAASSKPRRTTVTMGV